MDDEVHAELWSFWITWFSTSWFKFVQQRVFWGKIANILASHFRFYHKIKLMWLGCWFVSHLSFVVTNICVGNSNDTVLTEPWYVVICGRKCHGGEGGGGAIHIPQWFQYEKPAFAVTEQYIFGVWKLSKILVQSNQLAAPSSFSHLPHHTSVKGYFTNMNVKIDTAMTVLRHFTHLVLPWKIIWEQSPSANWISHLNLERCWCCSASAALNILFYHVFVKHDPSAIMKKKK